MKQWGLELKTWHWVKIQFQGMKRQNGLYWVKDREVNLGFRNTLGDGLMLHSGLSQWCPRGTVGKGNTLSMNRAEGSAPMSCMWREKLSRIWLFRNFLEVVNELGGLSSSCKNQYERISMREIRDKSVHRTKRRKNFKWLVEVDTSMSMFVLNINSRASLSAKHWITKCPWPFLCLHSNFMNEKMIDKEIAHSLTAWDPSFQGWCNVCFC